MKRESGHTSALPAAAMEESISITARLAYHSGAEVRWIRGTLDNEAKIPKQVKIAARKILCEEEKRIRQGSFAKMHLLDMTFTLRIFLGEAIFSVLQRHVLDGNRVLTDEQEIAATMVQRTEECRTENEAA